VDDVVGLDVVLRKDVRRYNGGLSPYSTYLDEVVVPQVEVDEEVVLMDVLNTY